MESLKRWLPVVAWSAVILIASGDEFSATQSGGWFRAVFGFDAPYWLHVAIRKLTHLVAYGILGFLALRASNTKRAAVIVALVVAVIDETHQSTLITRTGSPWDVLLDVIGAWLAVTFARPRSA
jgi:VanZ like family